VLVRGLVPGAGRMTGMLRAPAAGGRGVRVRRGRAAAGPGRLRST
jgi:hypothetical protein